MSKTVDIHGKYQLSIANKYKRLWNTFEKLVKKDKLFMIPNDKKEAGNPSRVSRAVLTLVYKYVKTKQPDFQLTDSNETSN